MLFGSYVLQSQLLLKSLTQTLGDAICFDQLLQPAYAPIGGGGITPPLGGSTSLYQISVRFERTKMSLLTGWRILFSSFLAAGSFSPSNLLNGNRTNHFVACRLE